jgi:hypothetical protein
MARTPDKKKPKGTGCVIAGLAVWVPFLLAVAWRGW